MSIPNKKPRKRFTPDEKQLIKMQQKQKQDERA